jgi:Domain of unknown function (DUF4175)
MPVTARSDHKPELKLERELTRLRRRLRARSLLLGALWLLVIAGLGATTLLLAYPLVQNHLGARGLLLLTFMLALAAALVKYILFPLFRPMPNDALLSLIEQTSPELRGRLSTALYLYRDPEVEKYGFSPDLTRSTIAFAEVRADIGELREFFNWRPVVRPGWLAVGAAMLLAMAILLSGVELPGVLTGYRFAMIGATDASAPMRFNTSGDLNIPPGQPIDITASLRGDPNADITLQLYREGGDGHQVNGKSEDGATHFHLAPIKEDHYYRVSSHGMLSPRYRIKLLTPPAIVRWEWNIKPPTYTGLDESQQETPSHRVSAPAGSWGELKAESNWPLLRVETMENSLLEMRIAISQTTHLEGALDFRNAGPVVVRLYDIYGQVADETLEVDLMADQPPEVGIAFPPRTWYPPDKGMRAPLEWSARDDYGITSATLVARINYNEDKMLLVPLMGGNVADGTITATTDGVRGIYDWDLARLHLLPGDEVVYWVEATDNRPPPGPGKGRSPAHTLRIPSLLEQYQEQFSRDEAQVEGMEEVLNKQREVHEKVKQIKESIEEKERNRRLGKESGESTWEEEKALEEAGRDQESLERELEKIREDVARSAAEKADKLESSMRAREKEKKIQELMDELLDDETKRLLSEFQKAMEELSQNMDSKNLEELDYSLEEYEKKLDRTLQQLQQLFSEQQVEEMLDQMMNLSEAQREITERTQDARDLGQEKESAEELARQQEAVKEGIEEIAEQLERLAEFNEDKDPEAAEKMKEMADKIREEGLPEDLESAQEQLQKEKFNESMESQQNAQQKMDQLSKDMEQMQQQMGGSDMQMDIEKIGAAARRTLFLSHRHEKTVVKRLYDMSRRGGWGMEGRAEVGRTLDIFRAENIRLLALIEEAMKDVPFVDNAALQSLQASLRSFQSAVRSSEEGEPGNVLPPANQGLNYLNEAILSLSQSLEEMQQMQQQQQPGGGGGGLQEQIDKLRDMAQRQEKLNQRQERMQSSPREKPGWEQMMQRMAQEQRAIREELETLNQQMEQNKEVLGDMNEVAKEMKEVEDLLEKLNPDDPRIKEKQEHILEKLLEGGKSLKEEEFKKERESETAKEFRRPEVLDLDTEEGDLQRTLLRRAEGVGNESILPRLRIPTSNYFRNLAEQL